MGGVVFLQDGNGDMNRLKWDLMILNYCYQLSRK